MCFCYLFRLKKNTSIYCFTLSAWLMYNENLISKSIKIYFHLKRLLAFNSISFLLSDVNYGGGTRLWSEYSEKFSWRLWVEVGKAVKYVIALIFDCFLKNFCAENNNWVYYKLFSNTCCLLIKFCWIWFCAFWRNIL